MARGGRGSNVFRRLGRLIPHRSSSRSSPHPGQNITHEHDSAPAVLSAAAEPAAAPEPSAEAEASAAEEPLAAAEEEDMWLKADRELRKDENKRRDLERFDQILEHHHGAKIAPVGTLERREQMLAFSTSRLKDLQDKQRQAKLGTSEGRTKRLFDAAVKAMVMSNDVIMVATRPCLPAAAACAGVMLLLSTYVQAAEERNVFYEGMDSLSWSVYRLASYERLLWDQHEQKPDAEVEHLFLQACSNILYFQARAAYYLEGGGFKRGLRDAFRVDGWNVLIAEVKKAEEQILNCATRKDFQETRAIFEIVNDIRNEQAAVGRDREVTEFLQKLYKNAYPYEDRKNRNIEPIPGTCKWFAHQENYINWESLQGTGDGSSSALLYVTADPGCGKSVLSRHLVDGLLPRYGRTVCYAFFKDDFDDQRTSLGALCALLHQVLSLNRYIFAEEESILLEFKSKGDDFFTSFAAVWNTFQVAASQQETVCVFDALDECCDADRNQLFAAIGKVSVPTLKFLFTSRPYEHITREISRQNDYEISTIHIQGDQGPTAEEIVQEIQLVVENRITNATNFWRLSSSERRILEEKLLEVPNRTYLWVTLVFDGLMDRKLGLTKRDIMELTTDLPRGVYDAYEKLLSKSERQDETRKLLKYVLAAERPLTLAETAEALQSDSQKSWSDRLADAIPGERVRGYVRDLCGLFVNIVDDKVYLLHQTAREFLVQVSHPAAVVSSSSPILTGDSGTLWQHSISLADSHQALAEVCICVLLLQCELADEDFSTKTGMAWNSRLNDYFYKRHGLIYPYSAEFWTQHYRNSPREYQLLAVDRAKFLCSLPPRRRSWSIFTYVEDLEPRESDLALASAFGLDTVVESLLDDETTRSSSAEDEIHAQDHSSDKLLIRAATAGYARTLRLLLAFGKVKNDIKTVNWWKAFYGAAHQGHKAAVEVLLTTGEATKILSDDEGQTTLHSVASSGYGNTEEVLPSMRRAYAGLTDLQGLTTLRSVASSGYGNTEEVLPSMHRVYGSLTDRHDIAFGGYENTQEVLSSMHRVYASLTDHQGRTPLHMAADAGHMDVTKVLLATGEASVTLADNEGCRPLHLAARNGRKGVVEVLLATGEADANLKDKRGQTPLHAAAIQGHEDIVEILLTLGNADASLTDNQGMTARALAARRNQKGGRASC